MYQRSSRQHRISHKVYQYHRYFEMHQFIQGKPPLKAFPLSSIDFIWLRIRLFHLLPCRFNILHIYRMVSSQPQDCSIHSNVLSNEIFCSYSVFLESGLLFGKNHSRSFCLSREFLDVQDYFYKISIRTLLHKSGLMRNIRNTSWGKMFFCMCSHSSFFCVCFELSSLNVFFSWENLN
jgi:hypothetical protein